MSRASCLGVPGDGSGLLEMGKTGEPVLGKMVGPGYKAGS